MEKKQNRSSIVRVIISNYNDKGIKEIKIRYNKQAQLDTFILETEIKDNKIYIKNIREKAREKHKYSFLFDKEEKYSPKETNQVEIIKKDKSLEKENEIIRKYQLILEISDKNNKVVIAKIKDILEREHEFKEKERQNIRREESQTERKLISEETIDYYSQIAQCPKEEIDAIKIYKVKRYLNYRSNMLLYFYLINDYLCKDTDMKEIWRIPNSKELDDKIAKISAHISSNLIKESENYNNKIEKQISKLKNSLEKDEQQLNKKIEKLENDKIPTLSENEIKEDVKKILELFSKLRHSLMHYEYKYFENLFENKKEELTEILNLNLFKGLTKIKNLKIENKTNYLTDKDNLYFLGRKINAKEAYDVYNLLCEQKNGFNNFINSFFVTEGEENKELKIKIDIKFKEKIARIKNSKNEKSNEKSEELENYFKKIGSSYIWDIHSSREYKKLYNERKRTIEEYNKFLKTGSKAERTEVNKKLLELKNQMEDITKKNSLFRLEYKLQIAFGFLKEEYEMNINKFKDEFDSSQNEMIKGYKKRAKNYLNSHLKRGDKPFDIRKLKKILNNANNSHQIKWLEPKKENNLFKFYILIYILLPREIKGDFLGFVKKHYYDIKNVEFLDENNPEITEEKLTELKEDSFFNKIRLFEKSIKKYEIIDYSILEKDNLQQILNNLISTDDIFHKEKIIFLFKFYQNIFKLYNDIEIHGLFRINKNLKEALKICEDKSRHLSFNKLINNACNVKNNNNIIIEPRNSIAHLNYENLFEKYLEENNNHINIRIEKLIEFCKNNLSDINLGYNYINDYFMRKEHFIFGQQKQLYIDVQNSEQKDQENKRNKILSKYNILHNKNKLTEIKKIQEILEELKTFINTKEELPLELKEKMQKQVVIVKKNEKNNLLEYWNNIEKRESFIKDSSDIYGAYKKFSIINLKRGLLDKIMGIFILKKFDELSNEELYEIMKLRQDVFIIEQKCIYSDLDRNDKEALHLFLKDEKTDEVICYSRILKPGQTYKTASIGRVLVNKKYRNQGYARKLISKSIKCVKEELKENEITIGAQNYLKEFYKSFGFEIISDVYDDEGIPHVDMYLKI